MTLNQAKEEKQTKLIEMIQHDLILIGSELASDKKTCLKLKKRIRETHIKTMEDIIADLEKSIDRCSGFQISGNSFPGSLLDVARTVARRLERRVVTMKRKKPR